MKVRQLSMFDDEKDNGIDPGVTVISPKWYYVQRRDSPYRTLFADELGRYYFGERDLIRSTPVLFNNIREAKRVARDQKGVVKKYPYVVK